jgi:hypothetical protein
MPRARIDHDLCAHRDDVAMGPIDGRGPSIRFRFALGSGEVEPEKPGEQVFALDVGRPTVSGQDGDVEAFVSLREPCRTSVV